LYKKEQEGGSATHRSSQSITIRLCRGACATVGKQRVCGNEARVAHMPNHDASVQTSCCCIVACKFAEQRSRDVARLHNQHVVWDAGRHGQQVVPLVAGQDVLAKLVVKVFKRKQAALLL
jgi:hypothetical protein